MRILFTPALPKQPDNTAMMDEMLSVARMDERRSRAIAVSARLAKLACHIQSGKLDCHQAAELLRQEAQRYENESQELH